MNKLLLSSLLLISITISTYGQDIQFSQFDKAPLNLNPALTGAIDHTARVIATGRIQNPSVLRGDAYNALYISSDGNIPLSASSSIGIGLVLQREKSGELAYGSKQARAAVAFQTKKVSSKNTTHLFSVGIDVGINERRIDLTGARWGAQNDGTSINCFGLKGFTPDYTHPEVAIGALWRGEFQEKINVQFGASIFHLNRAEINFLNDDNPPRLTTRKAFHGAAAFPLTALTSIKPSFQIIFQEDHRQINLGGYFSKYFKSGYQKYVEFGLFYKKPNEVIGGIAYENLLAAIGLNLNKIHLSLSYDYSLTTLRQAGTTSSGWEINFSYLIGTAASTNNPVKDFN